MSDRSVHDADTMNPLSATAKGVSLGAQPADKASSVLLTLIVGIGGAVLCLFLLFVMRGTERIALDPKHGPDIGLGRGDHAPGTQLDIEPPGMEEAELLAEPSVEQSLQSVTEVISTTLASLNSNAFADDISGYGRQRGDRRESGPIGNGLSFLDPAQRWELKFQARDLPHYAMQLDAFDIELGAIGGGVGHVDYLSQLSKRPLARTGKSKDEKRLSFISVHQGVLAKYDLQLLSKAGIAIEGRIAIKLIPESLQSELSKIEAEYFETKLQQKWDVSQVAKTVFECRLSEVRGKTFEWIVVDQRYRSILAQTSMNQ